MKWTRSVLVIHGDPLAHIWCFILMKWLLLAPQTTSKEERCWRLSVTIWARVSQSINQSINQAHIMKPHCKPWTPKLRWSSWLVILHVYCHKSMQGELCIWNLTDAVMCIPLHLAAFNISIHIINIVMSTTSSSESCESLLQIIECEGVLRNPPNRCCCQKWGWLSVDSSP